MIRLIALVLVLAACAASRPVKRPATAQAARTTVSQPAQPAPPPEPPPAPLQSDDILAREAQTSHSRVKHILISWADLAASFNGGQDPRAHKRAPEQAEVLVRELLGRARQGENFEALMAEYSEDQGSARSGIGYDVTPAAQLVFEFKRLGLRLKLGEIGVVKSSFGWHIMKRYPLQ